MKHQDYFKFTVWRIGFTIGSTWELLDFSDNTKWTKLGFGFYWRASD